MPETCPHCKEKIVRFPLRDSGGKILWINLFRMDLMSFLFLLSFLLMLYGYTTTMDNVHEALDSCCDICEDQGGIVITKPNETMEYVNEVDDGKGNDYWSVPPLGVDEA